MIRRPPRSTLSSSSAASDVYKRQDINGNRDAVRFSTGVNFDLRDLAVKPYGFTGRVDIQTSDTSGIKASHVGKPCREIGGCGTQAGTVTIDIQGRNSAVVNEGDVIPFLQVEDDIGGQRPLDCGGDAEGRGKLVCGIDSNGQVGIGVQVGQGKD